MSMPTIPDLCPDIDLNPRKVALLVLASIGLEEVGLAHIINAEGEKLQEFVGPCKTTFSPPASIDDILKVNQSVRDTLEMVICKECILNMKFDKVLRFLKDNDEWCVAADAAPVAPAPAPQP